MKKKCIQFILFQLLMMHVNAQIKIEKLADLPKIMNDTAYYEGYPLSKLLNNIEPNILKVKAASSYNNNVNMNFFIFHFISDSVYKSKVSNNLNPIGLKVEVKEIFEWDIRERSKKYNKDYWKWTNDDLTKYGKLTVTKYTIFGNDY